MVVFREALCRVGAVWGLQRRAQSEAEKDKREDHSTSGAWFRFQLASGAPTRNHPRCAYAASMLLILDLPGYSKASWLRLHLLSAGRALELRAYFIRAAFYCPTRTRSHATYYNSEFARHCTTWPKLSRRVRLAGVSVRRLVRGPRASGDFCPNRPSKALESELHARVASIAVKVARRHHVQPSIVKAAASRPILSLAIRRGGAESLCERL